MNTDDRLARLERLVLALSAQTYGIRLGQSAGIDWPGLRRQSQIDAAQILREQTEAPLETREAS